MTTAEQKAEALKRIADKNGGILLPDHVIAAAKDPRNILHDDFDWDDRTAAHQHRLNQARKLISSVRVIVETEDMTLLVNGYVSDARKDRKEQGYIGIDALARRKEDARATLAIELERIIGSVERTRLIAGSLGLASFFEAMLQNAIAAKLKVLRKPKKAA